MWVTGQVHLVSRVRMWYSAPGNPARSLAGKPTDTKALVPDPIVFGAECQSRDSTEQAPSQLGRYQVPVTLGEELMHEGHEPLSVPALPPAHLWTWGSELGKGLGQACTAGSWSPDAPLGSSFLVSF